LGAERESRTVARVDRGTRIFWLLVTALSGASVFFGVGAEARREAVQAGTGALLHSNDAVRLVQVVDGDTVLVRAQGENPTAVRLLGIKGFSTNNEKDPAAVYGRAAGHAIESALHGREASVLLADPPRDRFGRYVGKLLVNGNDLGKDLVEQGLVLAYPLHPFPDMDAYVDAQKSAQAAGRGLWGHPAVAHRAELLFASWEDDAL
jgi:micrococcal nuclease